MTRPGHMPTLSAQEMVILELLGRRSEMSRPQMVAASAQRLEARTLSPALRRLEENGLLASRMEGPRPGRARRVYHVTAAGRRLFELWRMLRQQLSRIPA